MRIQIPNKWKPRDYQKPAWDYLERGGRHAELIWHRRSGKDEIALHRTCVAAHERVANYWHMLPLATQVRKAIWRAVNPHTGKKRIDEAFPHELRKTTREDEMLIEFKNGSTWQALGSDNYEGAIGSTPAGIVYSEWAQSKPAARGFLRPIITENNGWQIFITTPRGKNHACRTYRAAKRTEGSFAQLLTVDDTPVYTPEQLAIELQEYVDLHGVDAGTALFNQEYYCSFEAAILGAVWGGELAKLQQDGRYREVPHNSDYPVYVAMDIGRKDATSIWFFQVIANEVLFIDSLSESFKDVDYFASQMLGKEVSIDIIDDELKITYGDKIKKIAHRAKYKYEKISLPHDAAAKRFGSKKTVEEQFKEVFGYGVVRVLPQMSVNDGIKYVRQMLKKTHIDSNYCEEMFEALKSYQYEYDENKEKFKDKPLHNWAADPGDGFRYSAMAWRDLGDSTPEDKKTTVDDYGINEDDDDEDSWITA